MTTKKEIYNEMFV